MSANRLSVGVLGLCIALCLGHVRAADTESAYFGTPTSPVDPATPWIDVRLKTPLENKLPDGTFSLNTGRAALDAAILESGVYKIEHALKASMRDPKDPEALAHFGLDRAYRFYVPASEDLSASADLFEGVPGVDGIGQGGACTGTASAVPDDPMFSQQWGFHQPSDADVDAPEAWDISVGNNVVIAVLDSGITATHADAPTLVQGYDFINDDNDPTDDNSHGTQVSSVIAGATNNAEGIAAACWNCSVMPLKVLDAGGSGPTDTWGDALVYATDHGASVVNISATADCVNAVFADGLGYAFSHGVTVVAPTGNDPSLVATVPAVISSILGVGATDPSDRWANFSTKGWTVDVVAPGVGVLAADSGGGYSTATGTSYAAAMATGLVGVMLSVNPVLTSNEVEHLIRSSADDEVGDPTEDTAGFDDYHGWGRLNMERALQGTESSITLRVEGKSATQLSFETPNPLAQSYDFVRGNLGSLSRNQIGIDLGVAECIDNDSVDASTVGSEDPDMPALGEGFFYVARFNGPPGAGWYGGSSDRRNRIVFDDATGPSTIIQQGEASAWTGWSVSTAGDVNGDGYDDVIVGAPGHGAAGSAFVYHGTPTGLSEAPAWSAAGTLGVDFDFGISVATAGDVNGDGYDDVIVGTSLGGDPSGSPPGRAYVFFGSASGVWAHPKWTGIGAQMGDNFGSSVAPAGDVNNDGYDDIIVGASNHGIGLGSENIGRVYVFLGSSTGVATTPAWVVNGDQQFAGLGAGVGPAGDVNGDGFDDVIVGAPWYDNGETNEGRAYVYHGSPSGLDATPAWTGEPDLPDTRYGLGVFTAGDTDNDGYDDIVVAAKRLTSEHLNEGAVFSYRGSPLGLELTPSWMVRGDQPLARFGASAAKAGDVNGDGYDDVIVGSLYHVRYGTIQGAAFVYPGSPSGLSTTPVWTETPRQASAAYGWSTATAGDVNGDGKDDVIVGAYQYDASEPDQGRAFVYQGPLSIAYPGCPD